MEIRQLRTFQAVATLLSFHRASERLNYAQSSVSAQIHALEEELDVQLFDRLGRRIALTDAGHQLLAYASKILNLVDETTDEIAAASIPQGTLTIRVPETLAVHRFPPLIKIFHERFPGVQLHFITCALDGLEKDLKKGITDLAFLLAESINAAGLSVEALGFEELVPVARFDHPLAQKTKVKTAELAKETFLFSRVDCAYRKSIEAILEQHNILTVNKIEFYSVESIKRCAQEGVGIAVLPRVSVEQELNDQKMVILNWEEGKIEVAILMIWYRERWLSPTIKRFMELSRSNL